MLSLLLDSALFGPAARAAVGATPAAAMDALASPTGFGLVLGAYLLGAVPFGWLLVRLLKGLDLREIGSGNIGATNAMRVLGKPWGVFAFALDFLKGFVPVALFARLLEPAGLPDDGLRAVLGTAAVLGHVFPVYLRFKGGKAVATGAGALVGIDPLIFLGAGLVWLVTLLSTRMVALASLAMGAAFPAVAWARMAAGAWYGWPVVAAAAGLTLLIVVRHRANLARILSGTEPKIGGPRLVGPPSGAADASPENPAPDPTPEP